MKKIITIISSIFVIIGLIISLIIFNDNDYKIYESTKIIKDKSNMVGVVLLQESEGSSTYIEQTGENADTFPTTGYHINLDKSKCENGGTVSYDSTNNKVIIDTNITDKCYVYFDVGAAPSGGNSRSLYSYDFNIMLETELGSRLYNMGTYEELQNGDYIFNKVASYCDDGTIQTSITSLSEFSFQPNKITCYFYYNFPSFSEKIINIASTNDHIYHHTSDTTADDYIASNAGDDSYRYSGRNSTVNDNYVCFGYDIANAVDTNSNNIPDVCENGTFSANSDYAYRIIGVFKDVDKVDNDNYYIKLIKAISYGNYIWTGSNSIHERYYNSSSFFKTTLNGLSDSYLATLITNGWNSYIAQPVWNVGGCTLTSCYEGTAKSAYADEMLTSGSGPTRTNNTHKISIMYVNEYGYAASTSYWTTALKSYSGDARNNDWLFLGSNEWTISHGPSSSTDSAFFINVSGFVSASSAAYYGNFAMRPVFYLSSSAVATGLGTISSPYILSMPS